MTVPEDVELWDSGNEAGELERQEWWSEAGRLKWHVGVAGVKGSGVRG